MLISRSACAHYVLYLSVSTVHTPFHIVKTHALCLIQAGGENRAHIFFMFYCFSFVYPSIYFFVLALVMCPVVLLARLYHPCADVVLGMLFTMRNQPLDFPFTAPVVSINE